jgi:uroporphyrin-III C-methyltransferase/precorrin-2 dehydrogenase/sirohydrochlorin ferrochelatase
LTAAARLTPPTLIIVGEVVKLHGKLAWFEPQRDVDARDATAAGISSGG